jgi:hypothetical protein
LNVNTHKVRQWLNDVKDPRELAGRLDDEYQKEMKPKVEELREKMQEVKIDTVLGALSIQVAAPWAVASVPAWLGVQPHPVTVAAGLVAGAAIAVTRVLRDRRKAQRELSTSPLAFLLRIEENLRPREVAGWIGEAARRFRFWK